MGVLQPGQYTCMEIGEHTCIYTFLSLSRIVSLIMEKYLNGENLLMTVESFINPPTLKGLGDSIKVLISTLYNPEPTLLAANRLGPDRLILLIDKAPDKTQEKAVRVILDSLGKVIDVKTVKTDVYDIVDIAQKVVDTIDMQPSNDLVFVNITSGRKTKALGVLFAAYARVDRVAKIAYNPEEDKSSVVYLPKLGFKLTESQKKVLEQLDKHKEDNYVKLAEKIGISKAMLYRNIDELRSMDLIITEDGLELTDAGKIARM